MMGSLLLTVYPLALPLFFLPIINSGAGDGDEVLDYDPASLREPESLHEWGWLKKGPCGWLTYIFHSEVRKVDGRDQKVRRYRRVCARMSAWTLRPYIDLNNSWERPWYIRGDSELLPTAIHQPVSLCIDGGLKNMSTISQEICYYFAP